MRSTAQQRPDVQAAIFARPTVWASCTTDEQLHYFNDWTDMLPYYEFFFKTRPQLRILIYSGDVDIAEVPHAYTQLCLSYLNRTVVEPWRLWTVNGNISAGYVETYDRYTYATVRYGDVSDRLIASPHQDPSRCESQRSRAPGAAEPAVLWLLPVPTVPQQQAAVEHDGQAVNERKRLLDCHCASDAGGGVVIWLCECIG